jgi:hypothetical protein
VSHGISFAIRSVDENAFPSFPEERTEDCRGSPAKGKGEVLGHSTLKAMGMRLGG